MSKKVWTTDQIERFTALIKPPTQEEKLKYFEGMTSEEIVENLLDTVDPDLRCMYERAIAKLIYLGDN